MEKKRAHNEGTIYQRSNGKWRAQVSINGRRLSYTAKTKKEGLAWIRETNNQIDKGLTYKGADTTLEEFLTDWIDMVESSRSKGTFSLYRWTVQKRINPYIGHIKLMDLRPDLVQCFYHQLLIEGCSNHAVHVTHKTLRVALNHAIKLGLIGRNPCSGTTPPKPKQTEMKFFDEIQVRVLLDKAQAIRDRFYPLYYLAVHTGMRQAELIGLKWEDVDWERRTIQVKRQVRHFKGGGYTFTMPKSKSGKRTIILGKRAVEVLREHQNDQQRLIEAIGEEWVDLDIIFASNVGTPVTANNLRRAFRRLLKASELPKIRFHDLRHTAASLMLNHGIPVLIASGRLGHSKPSVTMDVYGHLIPSKQEEAAELMDSLLSPDADTTTPKSHQNCTETESDQTKKTQDTVVSGSFFWLLG
ncbi:MAG: site-specific integrase [Chloroflexi bacterium]|nr:site-specific integrase [Chloroflexota bacterium]MBU1660432.1 site-specific integrase [Chloroflexota bacterium]